MPTTSRRRRRLASLTALAVLTSVLTTAPHPPAASAEGPQWGPQCQNTTTPVALSPGQPATEQVSGTLCLPAGPAPRSVQLLLPGGTYNRTYWNWPAPQNSYVDAATRSGHATLSLDRIGTGASTHPPGAGLTIDNDAATVHQVIQALKTTGLSGHHFDEVALVGHSLGSSVAWVEAANPRWRDADAVLITGMAHPPVAPVSAASLPFYAGLTEPAPLEPRLGVPDPTYLTTWPGTRGSGLLYPVAAGREPAGQQATVAADERSKDTIAAGELATFPLPIVDGTTSRITAPVLVGLGGADTIFCGHPGGIDCSSAASLRRNEAPHYPRAAGLQSYVLPGAGHDMNLSPNAGQWFTAANAWIDRALAHPSRRPSRVS